MTYTSPSIQYALLSIASLLFLGLSICVPHFASAQSNSTAELTITTQMQNGAGSISGSPVVTVIAPGASITTNIPSSVGSIEYASNFDNDTREVTFLGGSYSISVSPVADYTYSYSSGCNGFIPSNGGSAVCTITAQNMYVQNGSAQLTVYAMSANTTYPYNSYNNPAPSGAAISISGDNPIPSNFEGSPSGTTVTLGAGYFSVNPTSILDWTISQSGTCSGSISSGQTVSCTITYTPIGASQYPPPYEGNQYGSALVCSPSYQSATVGQPVTFTAQGGTGIYNWGTATQSFSNAGPTLTTTFSGSGTQTVIVASGSEGASCTVDLLPYTSVSVVSSTPGGSVISGLPNTGFAPQDGSAFAFAAVLLIAAATFLFPYVRIIFTTLLG